MSTTDLKIVKTQVEVACLAAVDNREDIDKTVNWSDLHCVEVRRWENEDGDTGVTAIVSEASPGAFELRAWLTTFLLRAGFPNVDIELEW